MPESTFSPSSGPAHCFDVELQRSWIESGDLRPALSALEPLLADAQTVRRFQGRLHLFVGGYDDDPRELWEITEVRQYLRALDRRFPFWFWFVDPTDPGLLLMVGCCSEVAAYGSDGDTVSALLFPAQLAPFLITQLRNLEPLALQFGIPLDEVARVAGPVLRRLGVDASMARAAASTN